MKYCKTIGGNRYIKCSKCKVIRNIDVSPECAVCKHPTRINMKEITTKSIMSKSMMAIKENIKGKLDLLDPKEQKIISLRFGLDDGIARTLEEVGKVFGVTRERIRQIEAKILQKIAV